MGNEASGYYHDHPYYDDYDDVGGWGVNRRGWAEVSQAALNRGKKAQEIFAATKEQWESRIGVDAYLKPGSVHIIPLLDPSHHLVEKVWKDFRKHVNNSNNGSSKAWKVQRRVATEEEKAQYKVTRQSKAYFIEATFSVPHATTTTKKQTTTTNKKKRGAKSVAPMPSNNSAENPSLPSKKPRLLANLTNNNNNSAVGAAATKKKKKNTPSTAAAASARHQPHMYLPQQAHHHAAGIHHHSYKYGDIVGLIGSSSNSNQPNTQKLAMVIGLVDPYTLLIVYPNQVQATIPIYHVQMIKPMAILPMPTTTMPTSMQQQQQPAVAPAPVPTAAASSECTTTTGATEKTTTTSPTNAAAGGEENQQQQQQIGVGN